NQGTSWAARMDPVPNRPNYLTPGFSWLYNNIVPLSVRYDPVSNPTGARATTWDHVVNLLGEGAHGFARRPLDNVGIQYGLGALNAGLISKEQFLDLNERIGGVDADPQLSKERRGAGPQPGRARDQRGGVTKFVRGRPGQAVLG